MKVRQGRLDDLETLTDFSIAMGVESEGLHPDRDTVRAGIEAALRDPAKARYFIAEDDGAVGSLFVTSEWSDWTGGWYWWIQGVYVRPDRRGEGVYSRLYEAVHEAARAAADVRRIRLYVDADNAAGIRAYEAHGMERTHYLVYDAPV